MEPDSAALTFERDGAALFPGAVRSTLEQIIASLDGLPPHRAGVRISGVEPLTPFLASGGPIGRVATSVLGPDCRAVRAILFDKTAVSNWSLTWHQDRTISVAARREVEAFGPWTVKSGMHHVAPPCDLLARMVTLRVHLDDVQPDNAPLLIAPGSHRAGLVRIDSMEEVVRLCGIRSCSARSGDIWLYATLILHASAAATAPTRRRVLQVDYAAEELSGGLRWLGV